MKMDSQRKVGTQTIFFFERKSNIEHKRLRVFAVSLMMLVLLMEMVFLLDFLLETI